MRYRYHQNFIKKKICSFSLVLMVICVVGLGCTKRQEENEKVISVDKEENEEISETDKTVLFNENDLEEIDKLVQIKVYEDNAENIATMGKYIKTIGRYKIDGVNINSKEMDLVQLFWQCEGSDDTSDEKVSHGDEWVINVFLNEEKGIGDIKILPCNYDVIKNALGNAKLMPNGEDAIKLAYTTYFEDSFKAFRSVDNYMNEWNELIQDAGYFDEVSFIYYGYTGSYDYPCVTVVWQYEDKAFYGTYQYSTNSTKVIGQTMGEYDDQVELTYSDMNQEDSLFIIDEEYSLYQTYQDIFDIGTCVSGYGFTNWNTYGETITKNFNRITCENEMKPDYILNREASALGVMEDSTYVAISFEYCADAIQYCVENNLKIRFHTLVWHAQTPSWFFYEDYDTSKNLVTKEIMIERMKNYISQVIEYFDQSYPDLLYAIDVVNEAFNGSGTYNIKSDDNLWYDTIGYEYVYYAFKFAREALDASEHMKDLTLVYNDYNMLYKAETVVDGLNNIFNEQNKDVHNYVDAVGFQGHYDLNTSMALVAQAMEKFCEAGYELQVTELDIGIPDISHGDKPTDEQLRLQAQAYKSLMDRLVALKQEGANITSVTLWGLTDGISWRQNVDGYDAFCLLFNDDFSYKPAYLGFIRDSRILSYYSLGINQ